MITVSKELWMGHPRWNLQFGGDEFLEDISRLGVKDPEECLVGEAWYLLFDVVDVVDSVTFR